MWKKRKHKFAKLKAKDVNAGNVDGKQLNNLSTNSGLAQPATPQPAQQPNQAELDLAARLGGLAFTPQDQQQHPAFSTPQQSTQSGSPRSLQGQVHGAQSSPVLGDHHRPPAESVSPSLIKYHQDHHLVPMQLHTVLGRNVRVSPDRTIAIRLLDQHSNAYVFTNRPLKCGEKLVIQILSTQKSDAGGLAFGLTACDPSSLRPEELPDDSDSFLDRSEYWVVCKDVYVQANVGDELSFYLTSEGEVRYGKNGQHVQVLMHVDKTLPLWAVIDVYGTTQKIKIFGVCDMLAPLPVQRSPGGQGNNLMVSLPPRRNASSSSLGTPGGSPTPPPRPPPIRGSGSVHHSQAGALASTSDEDPPALPPKPQRPPMPKPGTILQPTPVTNPTLAPTNPFSEHSSPSVPPRPVSQGLTSSSFSADNVTPIQWFKPKSPAPAPPHVSDTSSTDEAADNAANECSVCLERPCDCVIYTCGHMCACYDCAMDIFKNGDKLCPICRQEIKDIIKIFRS